MSTSPSRQNRARVTAATGGTLMVGGALLAWALSWASAQPDLPALAHGVCFAWFPRLLYLHAVSDGLIALAYYSIPVTLFYFARKRRDLPYAWMFVLFGAFIVACGTTHLLDVWTIWQADYWTSGVVKALTAAVSLPTAVALGFMVPRALRLPSAEALRQANAALSLEVRQRQQVEAQLRDLTASLERRVGERTAALQEANELLDAFFRFAPVGFAVVDDACRTLRANEVFVQSTRMPAGEHPVKAPDAGRVAVGAQVRHAVEAVLETGQELRNVEFAVSHGAEAPRAWKTSCYPIGIAGRRLVGIVSEDVTEQRRIAEEHARLREAAEAANRMKDEFFAKVSHELRTPLQATLTWVQLLRRGGLEREGAQQALERVDHNVRAQARMVSDLLDTSRVLNGRLVLDLDPTDLAQATIRAVDALRPQADAKAIELDVEVSRGLDSVLMDAGRFEQVIWNLLTNAIQATPERGRIGVRLARTGSQARLTVTDSGIGLGPEEIRSVFEPFQQIRGPGRAKSGLGLGLSIVQSIVAMMGGRIEVASDGAGRGATFTVTVPVEDCEPREADGGPSADASTLAGLRVLYVEDEPDVARAMCQALATLGAQVACVHSMAEALDHARAQPPDVLVSDLDLGEGGSGNDLLQALRAFPRHASLPAVALSAYGDPASRAASAAAGFDAHLVKPAAAERVAQAVRDAWSRSRAVG